ncbi:class C sortase [Arcanobacterium bovis]|uniref:Class C sortase n=1 Tax=Arcanobacterium bovis TaxID=2529275 RepID=A0A4Q9V1F8_9ACTO|nr:class C sortase [Arcanobacterium bovis]TBW21511.1 class C sortase [Arcanobacterium bovis]
MDSLTEKNPRDARKSRQRRRRKNGLIWILIGILILLYPVFATLYNDYHLIQEARMYSKATQSIKPHSQVQKYIDEAHAYNVKLAAQGHHARVPTSSDPGFTEYMNTLNVPETGDVIARIRIPQSHIDLPVFHTTTSEVLYRGAGHMYGSDLPVGGSGTTAVISAHTGMVNASMFDNLVFIKDGTDIFIEVLDQTLHYQVRSRKVVGPSDYQAVTYEPGVDKVVLITCTPYGINTDRLLVEAIRVPNSASVNEDMWIPSLSWWMILDITVVCLVLLFLLIRALRRKKRKDDDSPAVVDRSDEGKHAVSVNHKTAEDAAHLPYLQ